MNLEAYKIWLMHICIEGDIIVFKFFAEEVLNRRLNKSKHKYKDNYLLQNWFQKVANFLIMCCSNGEVTLNDKFEACVKNGQSTFWNITISFQSYLKLPNSKTMTSTITLSRIMGLLCIAFWSMFIVLFSLRVDLEKRSHS